MSTCKHCGIETANPKFCSRSCAAKENNISVAHNKARPRACTRCGVIFTREYAYKSNLCPSCFGWASKASLSKKTLAEYHSFFSVQGKPPSWKNVHIRSLNRSWNADLTKKQCSNCGYSKHIELCHRRAVANFPENATIGEVNAPENNVVLCPNCHWEFDNGLLVI